MDRLDALKNFISYILKNYIRDREKGFTYKISQEGKTELQGRIDDTLDRLNKNVEAEKEVKDEKLKDF